MHHAIHNRNYSVTAARSLDVQRTWLYRPTTQWTYSHHPHLVHFANTWWAIWSNGRCDEDAPGQRVLISHSPDFLNWSSPHPLLDSQPALHSEKILTAAGFHQHAGRLVAYIGCYEYCREALDENGNRRPSDRGHTNTTLLAMTSTDGHAWQGPIDLQLRIVPNHGPQPTATGRLILAGNTSFPYTDDPAGLLDWHTTGIYAPTLANGLVDDSESILQIQAKMGWPVGMCEGSFYQTDDHVLHMLLRTNTEILYVTHSHDEGATWSPPQPTQFSDNATKFHLGRLPDGRFYYVGCPDPLPRWQRSPLVLSLSHDGYEFNQHFILADSSSSYQQQSTGMHKGGEYGYPHTLVRGEQLHVIISRRKEAVQVLRVALPD